MSVARIAGPPPGLASGAWTVFLDLYELLNEFAIALIEVGASWVASNLSPPAKVMKRLRCC